MRLSTRQRGFTIVELLIVIVIIAVLAAITTAVFNGIRERANESLIKDGLAKVTRQLELDKVTRTSYALLLADVNAGSTNGVQYQYTSDGNTYCITATKDTLSMFKNNGQQPEKGACTGHTSGSGGGGPVADGSFMQTITSSNCPTTRTMAVDARDNRTYWVQKLADNKCWMLTNLAYAGGGTNTYGDVKALEVAAGATMTLPRYTVPSGANPPTNPTAPSTSTDGTGQYGYLYNQCAASGGQATAACANATSPAADPSISICPSGWRLPVGNTGGDFDVLNGAINGGLSNNSTGIRNVWLAMRSGSWNNSFIYVGSNGYYRTSTIHASQGSNSYRYSWATNNVNVSEVVDKQSGHAVRCLAS
jgi:uncharacterized protein (TIGR02145 family)/prepilin-type N-terminal cleavage/methylation domain-containing protein